MNVSRRTADSSYATEEIRPLRLDTNFSLAGRHFSCSGMEGTGMIDRQAEPRFPCTHRTCVVVQTA